MESDTIFGWLYAYLLMRRPGLPTYITCTGKTDGLGAQAQAVLSTQALAHAFGIHYTHTPFRSVDHAPGDPVLWAALWEGFLGLGDGEIPMTSVPLAAVRLRELVEQPDRWREQPLLVAVSHCHAFTDRNPHIYERIALRSRQKYARSSKVGIPLHRGPHDFSVAVHVRRGDVSHHASARYTPNGHVVRRVGILQRALNALGIRSVFNLYSEGNAGDFRAFEELGVHLHLDEDLCTTFHNMVNADALVMAKSSLSYAAALLSQGIVVYEPFWHTALGSWVVLEPSGISGELKLMRVLESRLSQPHSAGSLKWANGSLDEAQMTPGSLRVPPLVARLAHGDCVVLPVCDAVGSQNAGIGGYGPGMANFVPRFGERASVSWCVQVPRGEYDLSAEYAAEHSRPMQLLIDGELMTPVCMEAPTTGWFEADLQWQPIGRVHLSSDAHVLTVFREGDMPHLRCLQLIAA